MSEASLAFSATRLMRNTAARTVGSVVTLLAGAGTGLLVARHLGPQGYGSFAFVWSIAWALATAVPLGFDRLLVRELNREPPLLDLRRVLPTVVAAGAVAALVMSVVAIVFASERSLALALTAAALYVLASGPRALLRGVFDAEERMELTATTDVAEALATLALVVLLVLSGAGLVAISIAIVGARFLTVVAAAAMLRRWIPRADASIRRPLRTLLRSSLPMAGSRIASELLRRVDVLVLGLLVVPTQIGWYVAAATVALYAPVVLMELNRALYPVISRAESPEDRDLVHLFGLTWRAQLMLGTVAAAGLAVLAHPIITLLYGEAYAPAGPLLVVLAATIPLRVGGALCAVTLDATYRQVRHLRAAGIALAVNLLLNGLLIPVVGIWGAAVAAVTTEAVFLAVALRALRPHRPRVAMPFLWSVVVAAPVALAASVTPGPSPVRILAGGTVFGLMVLGLLWRRRVTGGDDPGLVSLVRGLADHEQEGPS